MSGPTDEITLTVTRDELRMLAEAIACFDEEWGVGEGQDDSPFFQSVKAKVLTARSDCPKTRDRYKE
jgi:hypothetical protein